MVSYKDDLDHGFMGMYDGRGVKEPAVYAPDFKQNYFRWNVHYRGDVGALKCVLNLARPTPERLGATRAVFPGDTTASRDFLTEPTGEDLTFDPARWYRFVVEWQNRTFQVAIDGVMKWKVTAPHDYAPVRHRLWLGAAPCDDMQTMNPGVKYANQVPGVVYRDLRVEALTP
jgi:hypothetical protein